MRSSSQSKISDEPVAVVNEAPVGFWADIATAIRNEMKTPASGFFSASPESPVKGILHGDTLTLLCTNSFTVNIVNKPEILALVARKASAKLGRQLRVVVSDKTPTVNNSEQMEQLLNFGRNHTDRINIKE